MSDPCVTGVENKGRINALEAELREFKLSSQKEMDGIRCNVEKKVDEIWKSIEDMKTNLIYRPTWVVTTIVGILSALSFSCLTYIFSHR